MKFDIREIVRKIFRISVITTSQSLREQGKEKFALLFLRFFPYGADIDGLKYRHYCRIVKDGINDKPYGPPGFVMQEDKILARCVNCRKNFWVRPDQLAEALFTQMPLGDCSCSDGNLIPVEKGIS